jgi:hypothetical protein
MQECLFGIGRFDLLSPQMALWDPKGLEHASIFREKKSFCFEEKNSV